MKTQCSKLLLITFVSLVFGAFSTSVLANSVKTLKVNAPDGFKNAPVLKVYSLDGEKWSEVDKTHISSASAQLYARCKYEGKGNKAYKGIFSLGGFQRVGDTEPANFLIPHKKTTSANFQFVGNANINPVKICNDELKKKVAQKPDLNLDEKYRKYPFLIKGFKVNYPAALESTYHLTCYPTGIGALDYKYKKVKLNAVIDCQASPLAKEKLPKPKLKIAKLVLPPMVSNVSFEPSINNYVGKCPTGISFSGKITASRPGQVKYRYVAKDGGKSPVFTLKFDKAGTKATGNWHETVSKPDKKNSFALEGLNTKAPDVSDWWQLTIVSPQSDKRSTAKYTVTCQDKPSRVLNRK